MADPADSEPAAAVAETGEDEATGSLVDDLRDLADDTRTAVEAEIAFQSARASYVAGAGKSIALWFALALATAIIALFALAVGALFALSPLVGPWAATAIVVGALLVVAVVAGWFGASGVRRLKRTAFPARPASEP